MHRHRRRSIMSTQSVTLGALAATVLLVTAACSSSGSSSGSDASSQQIPVVSVSLPSADPLSSDVILAQQLGYFTKLNVKLDLVTTGVTGMNQVSAGRRDLELSGTPSAFPPSAAGHATQVIYCWALGDVQGGIAVGSNSSIKNLMGLSGKSVGVVGAGGAAYGTAKYYSTYIVQHGGKPLNIITATNLTTVNAQVISGRLAASVGPLSYFQPSVAAGKMRILLDPSSSSSQEIFGELVGNSIWGLKSAIAKNSLGIERFLAGVRAAALYIAKHTPAQIAAIIKDSPILAGQTEASIVTSLQGLKPFLGSTDGTISEAQWNASLSQFKNWGLTVNVTDPQFSYQNFVDMSYLDAAKKLPIS
jgi:ABC-type nitrate/sulfonate/bicarbonate transport system substrate-binding protein